jgi:MYXO-CTERM domain-containing protein
LSLVPVPALAGGGTPAEMEPLTWLAVPDTKLQDVQSDPEVYAALQGNGFRMIIDAWNGGVLDTSRLRLVVWGGGHNDYYGNDMYAFDIASLSWERLTDPTVDWAQCSDPNSDGTANSRHSYNGMLYVQHADRMFVSGGALNCPAGGCGANITWAFDFDALAWNDRQPSGDHTTACGNVAAYDPAGGLVYFGDGGGLFAYSYDDNAWSQLNQDYIYNKTATVDTTRNQLVMVGGGEVWSYDLGGDFTRETWATTGGDEFVAREAAGLDYDPTTDRIVGWADGPVWVLDPESREWTSYDIPGAPEQSAEMNGTYGRWRYVPDVNAFVLVTRVDVDVHFFKLSDGGTLPPPGGDDTGTSDDDDGTDTNAEGNPDTTADDGPATAASASATDPTNTTNDPGTSGATESGAPSDDDDATSGCGCSTSDRSGAAAMLAMLAMLGVRRRRITPRGAVPACGS